MIKGGKYFVTGTDTDIGKTYVTLALMDMFKKKGCSVIGMKPISAGIDIFNGYWNEAYLCWYRYF